ncbi:MAG TPA: BTAD domain-containing putative transcriptional regulator [Streptosporangiaceae bacterium]
MTGIAEFRLLGPLEVVSSGHVVEIGSARQRIVLSMLLLQANQAVPLGRLVDAVWADTPPTTSKSQIQACISALRRQFTGAAPGCEIATRSVGYAILLPDQALDVDRFQQLVSRGRAAAGERRTEEAVQDLRAALDLWRGPAAGGVESKLVQSVATRLNENRISVLEECIELELALGRHRKLTGDLSELVQQYPLRERLRAQHMLALYRSGRQAEALESFRAARQLLIEELGLDPGEELRALECAVLASDPSLELTAQPGRRLELAGPKPIIVPRQLTAAIPDFVGREDLQRSVTSLLTAETPTGTRHLPIVAFTGKAGVGKSALALQIASAVRHAYPDGQLLAQLREVDGRPISPMEVQAECLAALGLEPATLPARPSERTAVYRSVLGDRRMLIVLDNAVSADQVIPLIPGSPNCAVIITSRRALAGLHGGRFVEVDDLDEQASLELLARVIGMNRVRAEPASALTLVRLCGCLPLALRIVAAKLATRRHWRIDTMVRRMADESRRLDELVLSGTGVRAALALSYNDLSPDARRLFLRLGLLGADDFAAWVTAPLLGADPEAADDVLDLLVESRLVEVRVDEDGQPRFRLHDLVRIFALERLAVDEPVADRARALRRLLGCWLSLAAEAHRRSYGGDFALLHSVTEGWELPADTLDQLLVKPASWLRAERAGLVSAVVQAAQVGFDELCWDLAVTSVTLFESEYQVDDWRKTHEIALKATRRAGNLRGQAAVLWSLGNLAVRERLSDAAHYLEHALRIFEQIGDAHGRALALATLGFVDRLSGHHDQAFGRFEGALAVFRAVGDRVSEVDALTNIAQIQQDLGHPELVDKLLGEALAICRSLRAPRLVAQTEHRLGEFFLHQGELNRAERTFRFVLHLVRDERDLLGEAYALQSLGVVHARQGQYALAQSRLAAALSLSRQLGDNLVLGRVLIAYAEYYLARGEAASASAQIGEALVVFGDIDAGPGWRAQLLELKGQCRDRADRISAAAATGSGLRPISTWGSPG